jgi:hypothetical protein
MVYVVKADGTSEKYSKVKVDQSMKRAGVARKNRQQVLDKLENELYDGISTKEIYNFVSKFLDQQRKYLSSRYSLEKAIMQLGPTGYPFEHFVAGVLKENGYQTAVSQELNGRCVTHEIDVVAQKDGEDIAVECKFHNSSGIKTDIKTALYIQARCADLKEKRNNTPIGKQKIDQMWLVTNTKLTRKAEKYCECVGMKGISWNYKGNWSLRSLVEESKLYPITCLHSISDKVKKDIINEGIVFCRNLVNNPKFNYLVPQKKQSNVQEEIQLLIESVENE